jgi:formate dehydrogenase major subunit
VLDAIEPDPVLLLHPQDLAALGVAPGERGDAALAPRRGQPVCARRRRLAAGRVFVAFCWAEAAINKLTNPALDPVAKIPEFKYCAVKAVAGGPAPAAGSFGGGQLLQAG